MRALRSTLTALTVVASLTVAVPARPADRDLAAELPSLVHRVLEPFGLRPDVPVLGRGLPARYEDATRGIVRLNTRTVASGATETYTDEHVHVTDDWEIFGTVNVVGSALHFHGDHELVVRNTGSISVTGASTIEDSDDDPATGGIITGTGSITIEGASDALLPVRSTAVIPLARGANSFAPTIKVRHAAFSGGVVGVATDAGSAAVFEHNTFASMGVAFKVLFDRYNANGANSNPTVKHTFFVDNGFGVFFEGTGSNTQDSARGQVVDSEFRANMFGVQCTSPGDGVPQVDAGKPAVRRNDFSNHLAEPYNGQTGISTPALSLSGSMCVVKENHFATSEAPFYGQDDIRDANNHAKWNHPVPPNPLPVRVVSAAETISGTTETLDGPMVVDQGGVLTVSNATIDANGHLWGTSTGGRITTSATTVVDNGILVVRQTNDDPDGITFVGPSRVTPSYVSTFPLHALQWRNSASISDWTADGFGSLLVSSAGLLTSLNETWTPSLSDVTARNATGYVVTDLGDTLQHTITGLHVENAAAGVVSVVGETTMSDSTFVQADIGYIGLVLNVLRSERNTFDGDAIALASGVLGDLQSTRDIVSSSVIGALTIIDSVFRTTETMYAFNGYAFISVDSTAGDIVRASFRDNYLNSLLAADLKISVPGFTPPTDVSVIKCTDCYFPRDDDLSYDNVTATEQPKYQIDEAPNEDPDVRYPDWWPDRIVADPGQTVDLPAILPAPAISRDGGMLRLQDGATDGGGRYGIGAKTKGTGNGTNGKLRLTNSTIAGMQTIAAHAPDADVTITDNVFTDNGTIAFWRNGPAIECNRFTDLRNISMLRQLNGDTRIDVRRNAFLGSGSVSLGLADIDRQDAMVEENSFDDGIPYGILNRNQPGSVTLANNNLEAEDRITEPLALRDAGHIGDDVQPDPEKASTIVAENNWWGDPDGPTVIENGDIPDIQRNEGSTILHEEVADSDMPDWQPHRTSPFAAAPCVAFSFEPASADEPGTFTFSGRAFDPSGGDITAMDWTFGDGGTASGATVSHTYVDGGTFTVTLTATTGAGRQTSVQDTVTVNHLNPDAAFTSAFTDESEPVAFTDTSTHPNGADAPPAGWAYAWDFDNNGTTDSTERNPSHKFPDGGNKTVKLTVTDNDGRTDIATDGFALPSRDPVASFSADVDNESEPVVFTDTSTHPNPDDAPPAGWTYAWDFEGEGSSTQRNPSFTFAEEGSKQVTLTVTDNDGNTDSFTDTVVVPHADPVAAFTTALQSPGVVAFTDTSTHPNPPDAPPSGWTYAWDFTDDGTFDSNDRNPVHDYGVTEGVFTVRLRVTDDDGHTDDATADVDVAREVDAVSLSPSWAEPTVNTTHTLTATATDPSGAPVPGVPVSFLVTDGPHAGTSGSGTTDADGRATFSYTGTVIGDDTVVATSGSRSGSAGVRWLGPAVPGDTDRDGLQHANDNCDFAYNPGQQDNDGDNFGDACDPDDDNDSLQDTEEAPNGCNPFVADTDGEGLRDWNEVGLGTRCWDADTDDDFLNDKRETEVGTDPLDPDTDDDGHLDGLDNCPRISNPDQADSDGDGIGDRCDGIQICIPLCLSSTVPRWPWRPDARV